MKKISHYIVSFMAVEVISAAAVALWLPDEVHSLLSGKLIAPLLGIVMFGMGMTLKATDFLRVFTRPRQVLVGTAAQFVAMPLIAFALVKLFRLEPGIAIGVILVGACPGGTASNVISYLAGGDVALSVTLTSVSTLLAPFLTPLIVYFLGGTEIDVKPAGLFISILEIVLCPVVLGVVANRILDFLESKSAKCAKLRAAFVESVLPAFSTLTVVVIVMIVVAGAAEKLVQNLGILLVVVILHNLLGLALGYFAGRLVGEPKTIAIEVGMQNSGLACSLAAIHFAAQPLAAVPGAIFSVWHNISGSLFANLVNRRSA